MASLDSSNSIGDQAAEWAVESAHGEMTPQSRAALANWLAADRRHRGAYARACAWLHALEEGVASATAECAGPFSSAGLPSPARSSDNDNSREDDAGAQVLRSGMARWGVRAAAGAAALAASFAALLLAGIHPASMILSQPESSVERTVQLKDGSFVALSPDADIRVALSNDIRRITMLKGAATFKVAKDRARPFVVRSGDVYAQATGTVYSVSRVGLTGGAVKVSQGSVLVWARDERDQAVLLHAGGTVTLDPGPRSIAQRQPSSRIANLPPPELAQISLDNVTIASAVARFNRVNSRQILIADPSLGEVRIIGLYKANDPEQFAAAAAAISGGQVVHKDKNIVIEMK